ncbi:MAG: hypothetical protein H7222_09955, partial [Methylotenera sp.]|nr:hypothetical protein [Oligoflexia bacterium]
MKIHNTLPIFVDCLKRWKELPTADQFEREFASQLAPVVGDFFEDFHSALEDLNWEDYRGEAMHIDPVREEARVRSRLAQLEELFGFKLEGEIFLLGAFTTMDGFARFDRGRHRVYLGMDESHGRGQYLDVLITHELTHVARETRPEIWHALGLDPKMPREVYLEAMSAIEHLFSEGFSCVISELLVPDEKPWGYVYQTEDSLKQVLQHGPAIDRYIHRELKRRDGGDYGNFYDVDSYGPELPDYTHYVWAWQWVKHLLRERAGGDPRRLVVIPSASLLQDALKFRFVALT